MEALALRQIERTRHAGRSLSMLSIGIDQADSVRSGGAASSALMLRGFAKACAGQLSRSDMVGRVDDTTFVALLPGVDSKGALRVAERLRTAVAAVESPDAAGRPRHITVSIGVVATRSGQTTYRALRSRADAKRDDASDRGGNRVNA